MKKIILSVALLMTGFSMVFAHSISKDRAQAAFQQEFQQASAVSWNQTSQYMKATFTLNKQIMYAYYDFEGKLIGVVHYMATSELPGSLQNEIKKEYARYWVTELFEVRNDEGNRFFILLKNATGNLVLSADGTDTWYIFNVPNFKLSDL